MKSCNRATIDSQSIMSSEWGCSVSWTEGSWTDSERVSEENELGDDHLIDASREHRPRKIAKDIIHLQTGLGSEPDQWLRQEIHRHGLQPDGV